MLSSDEFPSNSPKNTEDDWVVLTTVKNDIEYNLISELLKSGDIPSLRVVKGIDGFLQVVLGVPLAGIDLKVPQDKYEEALSILNAPIDDEAFMQEEE